jgi:nucleosome binding factor SPN SPT16 subunit
MTFKSTDTYRFNEIYREITELKKDVQKRANERKERADLVEQEALVEIRGKRPVRLGDVFLRPALEGKKFPGEIEIHVNGLRYLSSVSVSS